MIKIKKWLLVSGMVSASTLLSHLALAQEAGLSAVVDSRLTYDDNILRAAKEAEQSDTSLVVAPELTLAGILGKQRFSALYKVNTPNMPIMVMWIMMIMIFVYGLI